MEISLSFTDFWEGHDPANNILTNVIKDVFNCEIAVCSPANADINFVTVYGVGHRSIIEQYPHNTILWLGENIRPNIYGAQWSISFDFSTYNNTNFRLPLWMSEIDWYDTGLGVVKYQEVKEKLVRPNQNANLDNKDYAITIFNNPEGTRVEALNVLKKFGSVDCYGKPFGNWFPTYETYRDKLDKLSGYIFNLCPENSLFPGYYTEKCIHAKLANTVPVYMADNWVKTDFRPSSFINLYDFKSLDQFEEYFKYLLLDKNKIFSIMREPLLNEVPTLDGFRKYIKRVISLILSGKGK